MIKDNKQYDRLGKGYSTTKRKVKELEPKISILDLAIAFIFATGLALILLPAI